MADALSLLLWSLAEYFNYTAVALVILCSTLMTVFIIRLNGDHWGNYRNGIGQSGASLAHQKDVEQFVNPFFLTLDPVVTSTLSDGVSLQLSCLQPSVVHVFWGASINPVHAALLKQGREFVDDVNHGTLLLDQCLACSTHSIEEGKNNLHLRVPVEVSADSLGSLPRQRYPCVIVMTVADRASIEDHTSVVATVTALHVKDSQCRMQTHILAQYAKMAGHAVFNLQPLFFASSMDEDTYMVDGQGSHSMQHRHSNQQTPSSNAHDRENFETQPEAGETESSSFSETSDSVNAGASQRENETGSTSRNEAPSSGNIAKTTGQSSEREGACRDCDINVNSLYSSPQERAPSGETVFPECIVCQNQPLNCVLLPCRHTCVCSTCFQKLDRCPMCRSHVESFFHLRNDDDDDEEPDLSEVEQAVPRDLYSRFERWNTRLNQYLGFE